MKYLILILFLLIPKECLAKAILCIGGSTTYGVCLNRDETYPSHLQEYLPEHKVYNMGIQAGTTFDFIENIDYYKSLKPDLIIVAPVWNDVNAELVHEKLFQKLQRIKPLYKVLERIKYKLNHYYYFKNQDKFQARLNKVKEPFRKRLKYFLDQFDCDKMLLILPCLVDETWSDENIKLLTRKHKDPSFQFLVHKYYPLCQKVDIEVIKSMKLKTLDCSKMFQDYPINQLVQKEFFIDVIHLGDTTNQMIAYALSKGIR